MQSNFRRGVTFALVAVVSGWSAMQANATLVSSGVVHVQTGGTFDPGNIAIGGTAFAPDIEGNLVGANSGPPQPTGYNFGGGPIHTTTGVNNGVYGNTGAWLAGSPNSFVGLNLNGSQTLASVAFGRDNNAGFGDRQLGLVTLQYTQVASPGLATVDTGSAATGWQSIGTVNFTTVSSNGNDYFNANRNVFNFTPVTATGFRLVTATPGRGIDELELYSTAKSTPVLAGGSSIIQDETSNASGIGFVGLAIPGETGGNGQYLHRNEPGTFFWQPVLIGQNVTVEVSWGVSPNHTKDMDVFFDPDGAGALPEVLLASNINQTLLANQLTAPGGVAWSGFFTVGSGLNLTAASIFRVTGTPVQGGVAPEALSSAVWRFTAVVPEPATMGLLGVGMLAMLRRQRRQA